MGAAVLIEPDPEVEHAMNRVLAAERTAVAAVEECRANAQHVVEEARRRARRILDRAEDRSTRVHALADRGLEGRLAEIRAEAATLSERPLIEVEDLARVEAVVPLLVLELSGQGD
jgi:vacuolar-type H+-ATPase subunit H